jgi:hypothetical protein
VLILALFIVPLAQSNTIQPLTETPNREWNLDWNFKQQINLNIQTSSPHATYQPIDINIPFNHNCWGMDSTTHSIRVCCWDGESWNELESQIYNIEFSEENIIGSCNIIFLIPSYANGKEQYYVYYDDKEKKPPNYEDHVQIKDSFYYYEPIAGLSVEGDYYEIIDDEIITYGVGQKGKVMNRRLSQIAIRMKPETREFDILNSDLLTSFCFSYQNGEDDEDEIASDFALVGKEITIDGNLMTEFIIISESEYGEIKTTNIYRYYHCPSSEKRITVHIQHDITCDLQVKGDLNNDGRYGGIISYYSKSASMKKMQFGDILPYLHVYNEKNRVNEYQLIENPESSTREWIISNEDDCDLGPQSWISYSEGNQGKTHGIILSSNTNIISNTTEERDGIQIKLTEREFLDLVGAEIDYASIVFGRNSYEPSKPHDLVIEKGLHIEFDVEFITIQQGSYEDIHEESYFFQNLMLYRGISTNTTLGDQYIYTLTIIPHLIGRLGSFPLLANNTNLPIPIIYGELYKENELVASTFSQKSLLSFEVFKYPKLQAGDYIAKIYRIMGDNQRYIGLGYCNLSKDSTLHIYCTWEKQIEVEALDQNSRALSNITLQLMQGSILAYESFTSYSKIDVITVPFPFLESFIESDITDLRLEDIISLSPPYFIRAWYKGFKVYNTTLPQFEKNVEITLPVYDMVVHITDELNKAPDVNVNPYIISPEMQNPIEIRPDKQERGSYYFTDIPQATYDIYISYGGYTKSKTINIPSGGESFDMRFSYTTDVSIELLTIRGEIYTDENLRIEIKRLASIIYPNINHNAILQIPPGRYTVNVYDDDTLIGSQTSQISHDTTISVVTTRGSFIQIVFVASAAILLGFSVIMYLSKRITLNMCLKLLVLSLVFFSLVQPWWSFSGINEDEQISKTSDMYLYPQIMIEEYHEEETKKLSLSTIPDIFTEFLFYLTIIIGCGMILMFISFIPNIVLKKRFSYLLAILSVLFVLIVAISFYMGMSTITEISVGSLQGKGIIDVSISTGEKIYMDASWGLGVGFYTILLASSISLGAAVYDILKSQKKRILHLLRITKIKK